MNSKITTLIVCVNRRPAGFKPSCAARGSVELADRLEAAIRERRIAIEVERICCLGHCREGPTMRFAPGGRFFLGVTEDGLPGILDEALRLCGTRGEDDLPPSASLPPPGS
jgi:(2Fe-2S) ferredoxin